MKMLMCKDLGMMDCPFVAKGATEEEVMEMMSEHGMEAHADKMAGADMEGMKAMMMAKMKDM